VHTSTSATGAPCGSEVARVQADTGMDALQAQRHLAQRQHLQRAEAARQAQRVRQCLAWWAAS
jgi:hypothetical protein